MGAHTIGVVGVLLLHAAVMLWSLLLAVVKQTEAEGNDPDLHKNTTYTVMTISTPVFLWHSAAVRAAF